MHHTVRTLYTVCMFSLWSFLAKARDRERGGERADKQVKKDTEEIAVMHALLKGWCFS